MEIKQADGGLNAVWEQRVRDGGADFVYFVDITSLPKERTMGYPCAVLFGKALSKPYVSDMRAGREPAHKEIFNTERKMDALSVKIAEQLEAAGYPSVGKLKTGQLPHKTVALLAGLGFIGKNNLLVTNRYGCAVMLGKVLTAAPFAAGSEQRQQPRCGDCRICVDACPGSALLGATWSITTTREEILTRKLCSLCQRCMMLCPYTARYGDGQTTPAG